MILRGDHGLHRLTVGKGQHCDLRPCHALLNHHRAPRSAEPAALHHVPDSLFCLLHSGGDNHALSQRKTVCLDYDRSALCVDVVQRLRLVGKGAVFCGGDVILCHQLLGKRLGCLDDCGVFPGAEGTKPCGLHGIHHAQCERVVRGDDDEINGVLPCPDDHGLHVRGGNIHALRQLRNSGVSGGAVQGTHLGGLRQLPADGVLPSAAAYN